MNAGVRVTMTATEGKRHSDALTEYLLVSFASNADIPTFPLDIDRHNRESRQCFLVQPL